MHSPRRLNRDSSSSSGPRMNGFRASPAGSIPVRSSRGPYQRDRIAPDIDPSNAINVSFRIRATKIKHDRPLRLHLVTRTFVIFNNYDSINTNSMKWRRVSSPSLLNVRNFHDRQGGCPTYHSASVRNKRQIVDARVESKHIALRTRPPHDHLFDDPSGRRRKRGVRATIATTPIEARLPLPTKDDQYTSCSGCVFVSGYRNAVGWSTCRSRSGSAITSRGRASDSPYIPIGRANMALGQNRPSVASQTFPESFPRPAQNAAPFTRPCGCRHRRPVDRSPRSRRNRLRRRPTRASALVLRRNASVEQFPHMTVDPRPIITSGADTPHVALHCAPSTQPRPQA